MVKIDGGARSEKSTSFEHRLNSVKSKAQKRIAGLWKNKILWLKKSKNQGVEEVSEKKFW